jgi:hypothetical protein
MYRFSSEARKGRIRMRAARMIRPVFLPGMLVLLGNFSACGKSEGKFPTDCVLHSYTGFVELVNFPHFKKDPSRISLLVFSMKKGLAIASQDLS